MTDKEFLRLSHWANTGGGVLEPFNEIAVDLVDITRQGEVVAMLEVTARDIKFHRAYFSLINYIYEQMPRRFRAKLARKHFHQYLKHLKGNFNIIAQFSDIVLVEYDSISFARMSEYAFREYVKEQLPWIYTDVIGKYYKVGGWRYNRKIEAIENEYARFLSRL